MLPFSAIDLALEPVVEQVIHLLQLTSADTDSIATTDPVVVISARNAYHQVVSYLNRDFLIGTHTERYDIGCGRITLKNTPVKKILNVWSIDSDLNEELLDPDEDYEVIRNTYIKINSSFGDDVTTSFLRGTSSVRLVEIIVEYEGGYSSIPDAILSGIIIQTLANYNRISVVGVTKVEGSKSSVSASHRQEQLVQDAKVVLDPYRYYGTAVTEV